MAKYITISEHDERAEAEALARMFDAEGISASIDIVGSVYAVRVAQDDLPVADRILDQFFGAVDESSEPADESAEESDTDDEKNGWLDRAVREPQAILKFDCAARRQRRVKPDRLTEVAAHATLAEADLVRERLAAHEIESCLGNAATILWCWLYGTALGGVRVFVMSADRDRALTVIENLNGTTQDDAAVNQQRWQCSACAQSIRGDWQVCWACGTDRDGGRDASFQVALAPGETLFHERHEGGPLPLWVAVSCVLFPPFLLFYALTKTIFHVGDLAALQETEDDTQERERAEQEQRGLFDSVQDESRPDANVIYNSIVSRAVLAGVFGYLLLLNPIPGMGTVAPGLLVTPLLNIYSFCLLWKRHAHVPLEPRRVDWRVVGAYFLNLYLPLSFLLILFIGLATSR